MNQQAFDDILKELGVIGSLQSNQKLHTRCQKLCVSEYSKWQWLQRATSGEGRHVNVERLESIIKRAVGELRSLIGQWYSRNVMDGKVSKNFDNITQDHDVESRIEMLSIALEHACHGLNSLKSTYAGDAAVVADLTVLGMHIVNELALAEKSKKCNKNREKS